MDYSIASREGFAIVTDNGTGHALLTVPWKTGPTMCFTVLAEGDEEDVTLIALAYGEAGISPMDLMPEEVRNLAEHTPQTRHEEDGSEADEPLALAAEPAAD